MGCAADGGGDIGVGGDCRHQSVRLIGRAFPGGVGFGVGVGSPVDGDGVFRTRAGGKKGEFGGGAAVRCDVVEGKVLKPESRAVEGLDAAARGGDGDGGRSRIEAARDQRCVVPKGDFDRGVVGAKAVERGPVDPVVFWGVDGLQAGRVVQVEREREAVEIEVRQVLEGRVLEKVIRVIEDGDREIGRIAECTAGCESGG